ncbi:polysaccharide deacetylase family protein [Dictyobacter arantiisoli]|nr:polysaccharide deacetylase family protein [Dictyobacter arantiisoli]
MRTFQSTKIALTCALIFILSLMGVLLQPLQGVHAAAKAGTPAPTTPAQARVIGQGRSDLPKIALTFDDGPNPTYTPQVLSILAQHHVHATFFAIGNQVQSNPNLVKQAIGDGNVVEDHTWDHPDLTKLTPAAISKEVTSAADAVQKATGQRPGLLRPPYGSVNATVRAQVAALNMTMVIWNVDTVDWSRPGVASIENTALNNAHNGSIILMHDGGGDRSQTVAALPHIITTLQQRGYQLVTVPDLLHDMNIPA